jgi:hypothetical protein
VGDAPQRPGARSRPRADDLTMRGRSMAAVLGVAIAAATASGEAQTATPAALPVRWAVGEYLEYSVKYGALSAGSGRMQVVGRDTVRGRPTWHLRFDFSGGILMLRVNDSFDSWIDTETHHSLRFEQNLLEIGKRRHRLYEIFPDRAKFRLNQEEERESVADPLDDAAFFYFIRTIPLEVGKSYDFHRYFDMRANPVTIRVLRKEKVTVPAGEFDAIVIQPMIKTNGIFSEGGHAELWLSDDDRRILLQMKSKLAVSSLNLYLRKFTLPPITPGDTTRTGGR